MSESQIREYRLFIVAGGNFVDMGKSLTASTTANVRNAVKGGLNYLGICAGGFLAGSFPAPYNSFNLSSGEIRLLLRRKHWYPQGSGEDYHG